MPEAAGLVVGAVLTLLIFSYLLGDNPLYRLALHLFVGALVGYSFGIVLRDVLLGMVLAQLLTNPLAVVLGMLLLFKGFPRQAYVGNFSVAYLVGVGTAVALSGALLGTLVPQVGATGRALSPASLASSRAGLLDGLLIVVGTTCTLMASAFAARTHSDGRKRRGLAGAWAQIVRLAAGIGRIFIIFAFAVAFAGALTASLSIFIGRIQYLIDVFTNVYFRVLGG